MPKQQFEKFIKYAKAAGPKIEKAWIREFLTLLLDECLDNDVLNFNYIIF